MPGYARTNNNTGSFLHILDPRTKLILTTLFTVLVFIIDVPLIAAVQMLIFTGLCLAARLPFKKIFPHVKILLVLSALVIAMQTVWGGGVIIGLMIACRLAALTVLMTVLTATTDTRLMCLGITRMGINYKTAFIISSAFNLIPSFEEEAHSILEARKLRGMKAGKLREYPAIALPLMVKAMRQAGLMALAMDTRAFGAYKTRTWIQTIQLSAIDYWAFLAGTAYSAGAVAANCLLKG